MSTRRRWIATVAMLLSSIAVQAAPEPRSQAKPTTVTLVIEGMT